MLTENSFQIYVAAQGEHKGSLLEIQNIKGGNRQIGLIRDRRCYLNEAYSSEHGHVK